MFSSFAVNSLDDMASPVAVRVDSSCRRTIIDILVYMSFQDFDVHIVYPLFLKLSQYRLNLHLVEGFLVVDERDAKHFSFSWFSTWMWSVVVECLLLNPACSCG